MIESYYQRKDPIKGINFFSHILKNNSSKRNDTVLTFVTASLANLYAKIDRYDQACKLYYLSQKYARKINDIGVVAWNNIYLGNLYFRFSSTSKAKEFYYKSYLIADSVLNAVARNNTKNDVIETDFNHLKSVSTENIGMCFQIEGKSDSAYYYLTKYSKLRINKKNQLNAQYYFSMMSDYFVGEKIPDSVIYYCKMALDIDTTTFDINYLASNKFEFQNYLNKTNLNLSLAYYLKNQNELSQHYENILMSNIAKTTDNINNIGLIITLANFYFSHKDFNKCIFILENKFDTELKKYFNIDISNIINKLLSASYAEIGNYQKANNINTNLLKHVDSILIATRLQSLSLAETDVNLLENLEKIEYLEEKSQFQQSKLEAQKITNMLYIYLLVAILLILMGLIFTYISNKKHFKTISIKNEELNKLNSRLEESIKIKDDINVELTASQHELQRINENIEAANQTKNKLFSIIAHDMKNAIGGMRTLNQFLVNDYDKMEDEEKREMVNMLNTSSLEIYKLMENLLVWSSSQRGKIHPNKEYHHPYYVSMSSITLYRQAALEKNIQIINELSEEFGFVFDASLLDTILRNLINNAIKFSLDGGHITVSMIEKGDFVQFSVADNGVGIDTEKAKNIFSLDKTKISQGTKGEKGTGLGLMVCQDFVKMHNGKIWFESEVGKGTTAYFTFEHLK